MHIYIYILLLIGILKSQRSKVHISCQKIFKIAYLSKIAKKTLKPSTKFNKPIAFDDFSGNRN